MLRFVFCFLSLSSEDTFARSFSMFSNFCIPSTVERLENSTKNSQYSCQLVLYWQASWRPIVSKPFR
uniref:Putative secreted protein n=1 Tax=Anopheles marajoara TaxID=58244 RepID=A0A2M4CFJ6_9DIPT